MSHILHFMFYPFFVVFNYTSDRTAYSYDTLQSLQISTWTQTLIIFTSAIKSFTTILAYVHISKKNIIEEAQQSNNYSQVYPFVLRTKYPTLN